MFVEPFFHGSKIDGAFLTRKYTCKIDSNVHLNLNEMLHFVKLRI